VNFFVEKYKVKRYSSQNTLVWGRDAVVAYDKAGVGVDGGTAA
jgi:hypothetical protein